MTAPSHPVHPTAVTTVLCDADGTLFPSEEPAYAASADVTNRLAAPAIPLLWLLEAVRRATDAVLSAR